MLWTIYHGETIDKNVFKTYFWATTNLSNGAQAWKDNFNV